MHTYTVSHKHTGVKRTHKYSWHSKENEQIHSICVMSKLSTLKVATVHPPAPSLLPEKNFILLTISHPEEPDRDGI